MRVSRYPDARGEKAGGWGERRRGFRFGVVVSGVFLIPGN
jgi:hypothetical protein